MQKKNIFYLVVIILFFAPLVTFSQSNKPTKEEIIKIAISKAQQLGYKTEETDIIYDEDNKKIKEKLIYGETAKTWNEKKHIWEKTLPTALEKDYPKLKGKDYALVCIKSEEKYKDYYVLGYHALQVFIDKNTGEILDYIQSYIQTQ